MGSIWPRKQTWALRFHSVNQTQAIQCSAIQRHLKTEHQIYQQMKNLKNFVSDIYSKPNYDWARLCVLKQFFFLSSWIMRLANDTSLLVKYYFITNKILKILRKFKILAPYQTATQDKLISLETLMNHACNGYIYLANFVHAQW